MKRIKILLVVLLSLALLVSCNQNGGAENSESPSPAVSPSAEPTVTAEPTPTPSVTPEPTEEPTVSPGPSPTPTTEPSPTPSPVPTATASPSPTPTPSMVPGNPELKEIPVVRGIYLSESHISNRTRFDNWLKLAEETQINTFVINVKNDSGYLVYDSQNETAKAAGAIAPAFNVKALTDELHANGIYAIARIVCFKDDVMGEFNSDWALKKTDGTNYREITNSGSTTWMDISNVAAGEYIVEIAREVLEKGFDEVQFDYIRFPGNGHGIDYSYLTEPREFYVERFINYASTELSEYILSADIFGITCIESYDAGGIGQSLSVFSQNVDVISPMIYPSHYANSSNSTMGNGVGSMINGTLYEKPDLDPYGVVYDTLALATSKMNKIENFKATMRPYIQGFTASYLPNGYWAEYDAEKFQLQMQAVYDAGYDSWIIWDSSPSYTKELIDGE
ncbi:MAG TPA: putative glycoside hydrolase [Clostridia bacterium]|nr:putative glycoside hydrolase [Clostridia bacterium]HPQ46870.1 putative glycoside hydrolase [Clostridia bacterium]HRX41153.1 putative glycoside hydrolase [Clostridia bacterium]